MYGSTVVVEVTDVDVEVDVVVDEVELVLLVVVLPVVVDPVVDEEVPVVVDVPVVVPLVVVDPVVDEEVPVVVDVLVVLYMVITLDVPPPPPYPESRGPYASARSPRRRITIAAPMYVMILLFFPLPYIILASNCYLFKWFCYLGRCFQVRFRRPTVGRCWTDVEHTVSLFKFRRSILVCNM